MLNEPNLIIIADDDPDDCLFLLTALLSMPLELTVITVPNGERLIKILEAVSPQFIFLDINMPKMNGFDTLKQICSKKGANSPKVIMFSTSSSANNIKTSLELGADMYVTKPNSINAYNRVVERIFKMDMSGIANERITENLFPLYA